MINSRNISIIIYTIGSGFSVPTPASRCFPTQSSIFKIHTSSSLVAMVIQTISRLTTIFNVGYLSTPKRIGGLV